MNRYFTQQVLTIGAVVSLEASIAKHALKVLRQQPGDHLELAANDHAYLATIVTADPFTVSIEADITKPVELPIAVHLVCGVPKGDKAELIVQKATELGAKQITFFNSQWATARWPKERVAKKLARLQAIAQGAAEQSHRNHVPTIDFVADTKAASQLSATAKLVAYEESAKHGEAAQLVKTVTTKPDSLIAVFGPEGGLAPEEINQFTALGFELAGLGPRILRTETAPLYLLSAISTLTELGGNYA